MQSVNIKLLLYDCYGFVRFYCRFHKIGNLKRKITSYIYGQSVCAVENFVAGTNYRGHIVLGDIYSLALLFFKEIFRQL